MIYSTVIFDFGGVITSSLLTLVVVPVMYCYMDDLAHWLRRVLGPKTVPSLPSQTG